MPYVSDPTPAEPQPRHERYLTVFLIDGLAHDVFTEELGDGGLPNLSSLIQSGAYVERGITSFPSVSGYAHYPFLTGEASTESGIFGLRWFDRSRTEGNFRNYIGGTSSHLNSDLSAHAPTLFEHFSSDPSVAFNSIVTRGAGEVATLGMDFVISKYKSESITVQTLNGAIQVFNAVPKFGLAYDIAANHEDLERKVFEKALLGMEEGDRVQFIVLTTLDNMNHLEGYRTDEGVRPEYVNQLRLIDDLIGEYRRRSIDLGTEVDRVYLVTSDHGVNRITKNISIAGELERDFGFVYDRDTAARWTGGLDKPLADYVEAGVDVIEAIQGNNQSYLYFRNPNLEGSESWHRAPAPVDLRAYPTRTSSGPVDLIDAVSSMEGVELVVHRSTAPGVFLVTSAEGTGEITVVGPVPRRGGAGAGRREGRRTFAYRVIEGTDPLAYNRVAVDEALDADEWLRLTFDQQYPYAVPLLGSLLSAHPDADMVVTSQDGYDLGLDFEFVVGNYMGGHGGLDRRQMIVPVILTGPGVKSGARLPYARAEDVGSTVLHLMGVIPVHPERVLRGMLTGRTAGALPEHD